MGKSARKARRKARAREERMDEREREEEEEEEEMEKEDDGKERELGWGHVMGTAEDAFFYGDKGEEKETRDAVAHIHTVRGNDGDVAECRVCLGMRRVILIGGAHGERVVGGVIHHPFAHYIAVVMSLV